MRSHPVVWAERLLDYPIIHPHMDSRMGDNINGPCLIRAPSWLVQPLGRYYLYFAHHHGSYIRLAYAERISGPWTMYEPGVLPLERSGFQDHLASPEARVDEPRGRIVMYYHGLVSGSRKQMTRVAQSADGVNFDPTGEVVMDGYARVFDYGGWLYAIAMPGVFFRSRDGLGKFEPGPTLFAPNMRHCAVHVRGDLLHVFYTNRGDDPESILHCQVDLRGDWMSWSAGLATLILAPERSYEGADLPRRPSQAGAAPGRVCQLRDPGIFCEDGQVYLLYSVAGESGIALARVHELANVA